MTRSRAALTSGTSSMSPRTMIVPAMPARSSWVTPPCLCGWYQNSPAGWSAGSGNSR